MVAFNRHVSEDDVYILSMKRWMCSGTNHLRNTPQTTVRRHFTEHPKGGSVSMVWRLEHVCRAGGKILKLLYKTTWKFLKVCKGEPSYEQWRQSLKRRVIPTSTRAME